MQNFMVTVKEDKRFIVAFVSLRDFLTFGELIYISI